MKELPPPNTTRSKYSQQILTKAVHGLGNESRTTVLAPQSQVNTRSTINQIRRKRQI